MAEHRVRRGQEGALGEADTQPAGDDDGDGVAGPGGHRQHRGEGSPEEEREPKRLLPSVALRQVASRDLVLFFWWWVMGTRETDGFVGVRQPPAIGESNVVRARVEIEFLVSEQMYSETVTGRVLLQS